MLQEYKNIHNLVCNKIKKDIASYLANKIIANLKIVSTPKITCDTDLASVSKTSIFTSSKFQTFPQEGYHDKTDWILYKSGSEVWSSKNDTTNKTTITGLPLEVSTTYTLKVRYHDSINDIWSDYGSLEFTTFKTFAKITTPTISLNQTENIENVIITSSNFIIEGSEGSHDKTDWILYKSDDLNTEIWSSKNDTTNKTPITGLPLEVSTTYTLKVRYHDSINDIWSDYGSLEFTTSEYSGNPDIDPYVKTNGIHFIGADARNYISDSMYFHPVAPENLNFFKNADTSGYKPDTSNFEVVINNEVTNQSIYSITFSDGDDVLIRSKNGTKFPYFNARDLCSFKEILEPFPKFWKTETEELTDFTACINSFLEYDRGLTGSALMAIPDKLFDNNINATSFYMCLEGSINLTTIPEKLFSKHKNVTNFNKCFAGCKNLTSIPIDFFANNSQVTNFGSCFYICKSLTPVIRITSPNVTNVWYFASGCASTGTVYVPSGSTTATTFKNGSSVNVNVIEE